MTDTTEKPTLDLKSGGWALVLGCVLAVGAVAFVVANAPGRTPRRDLSTLGPWLLPKDEVVVGSSPEALPPLVDPPLLSADEAVRFPLPKHAKLLVPDDRVIGVVESGVACAYPLRVLVWHEVVDHTLGGRPIVVTYSPLTDAVRVFDRRVGGETLTLQASGLLWSSSPLLEERDRPGSLWGQLQGLAVAGPAARTRLVVVPHELTTWREWRDAHPDTRVVSPDPERGERYRSEPYSAYAGSEQLRFPVKPLPPADVGLPLKAPVVVVGAPGQRVVYPLAWLEAKVGAAGAWTSAQGVTLTYRASPPRVRVDGEVEVVHCSWFAWYATHPDDARLTTELR
jgi:hypothetical protein